MLYDNSLMTLISDAEQEFRAGLTYKKPHHIQMIPLNYDILRDDAAPKLYPHLFAEVKAHDRYTCSSWYELSNEAYAEYEKYIENRNTNIAIPLMIQLNVSLSPKQLERIKIMQAYCDLSHYEYNDNGCCEKECISLDSNGVCCNMRGKVEDFNDESED